MESLWHKPSGPGGPLKGNVPLSKTPGTLDQSGTLCPFRNVKDQQICMSEPLVSSRKRQQGPRLEWRSWFLERLQGCLELLITLFGKWGENVSWGVGRGRLMGKWGENVSWGRKAPWRAVFLLWAIVPPPPDGLHRHQPSHPRPQTSQTCL